MKNNNYTIISDPGIDDLIALMLFKKLSPKSANVAISTFGNVPLKFTSKNLQEFISFTSPNWLYQKGAENPLMPLRYPWPDYFHGLDGVWNIHPKTKIKKKYPAIKKFPNKVISLGPMTSFFDMMKKTKITNATIMGGALKVPGNETPHAETNIAFDPDAASFFFTNCQNMNVCVVPLDVTKKVSWDKKIVEKIPEKNKLNIWAKKLLLAWFENYGDKNKMTFDLHDPLAIYSLFYPKDLYWIESGISVVSKGNKRGWMKLNKKNPLCKIALDIKNKNIDKKIFNILFLK